MIDPMREIKCESCSSIAIDPDFIKIFNIAVCAECKDTKEDYALLTKTECRQDYLLTESILTRTDCYLLLPSLLLF